VGCEWLHSADRNAFVDIAKTLNIEVSQARPHWREQTFNIQFPADDFRAFRVASDQFYERCEEAAELDDDRPASACLEPGNRWNGLIDAISTYINGTELNRVSIHDMDAYEDSEINWRPRRGYGALIAAYGAPCPVALNTQVLVIDHSGSRVMIETSRGTISAAKAIVTVPTTLLANESIRFRPALPEKVVAAAGLPLGLANKVMLAIDASPDFIEAMPANGHLFSATDRAAVGSYDLRPFGQPCIAGFFGGAFARDLEDADALATQSIDDIVKLLGSEFRGKLRPLAVSRWANDPFAQGSYSHALPDHAEDREELAVPLDNRLFFAGEATSPHFFSTAHGALESGIRAAREVLDSV